MSKKYVECLKCGTIHYIINKEEADSLIADGYLVEEFSDRSLSSCSNCGSKKRFSDVTDDYVDKYASGDGLHPILLDDGEQKSTTTNKP